MLTYKFCTFIITEVGIGIQSMNWLSNGLTCNVLRQSNYPEQKKGCTGKYDGQHAPGEQYQESTNLSHCKVGG